MSSRRVDRVLKEIHVGSVIDIDIVSLARGGHGIARHFGLVVFVPYSVPGDRIRCKVVEHRKTFAFGKIMKILESSPQRVEPRCPVFGSCGGCTWQNVAYEEQVKQKDLILRDAFERSRITVEEFKPFVPSPMVYGYRNRIQVRVKSGLVGYFRKKSHELVPITRCDIAEPELSEKLDGFGVSKKDGRYELRAEADTGKVDKNNSDEASEDESLDAHFHQVNSTQNQNLVQAVCDLARELAANAGRMLELYAGSGNFTFPLADCLDKAELVAVELNPAAVSQAKAKVQQLGLGSRVAFFESSSGEFLSTKSKNIGEISFALLDPPRSGCDALVLKYLKEICPPALVYVSCDPQTLARDLVTLRDHYRVVSVQGFDMFPHTDHIEAVVALRKDIKN